VARVTIVLVSEGRMVIGQSDEAAHKVLTSWRATPSLPDDHAARGVCRG
jgi:hypothetical protein